MKIDRDNDWAPLGTTKVAAVAEMLRVRILGSCDLDSWNKELELTCARNFALKIGTHVGIIVKERCAKNGEKRRTRF